MSTTSNEKCAVHGCTLPTSRPSNLCDKHGPPGLIVRVGDSDFVITAWVAKHDNEDGIILMDHWNLGRLFGGRAGFEKKLRDQGFVDVRNICTPEEFHPFRVRGKPAANWSGNWLTEYPWESTNGTEDEDLAM